MSRRHRYLPAAAVATLALALPAASQTAKKGPETLLYIDLASLGSAPERFDAGPWSWVKPYHGTTVTYAEPLLQP